MARDGKDEPQIIPIDHMCIVAPVVLRGQSPLILPDQPLSVDPISVYAIPALRDPRWLGVTIGSEPMMRALLTHIARDLENASGDLAVERLVAQANGASDVVDRRAALTALGAMPFG